MFENTSKCEDCLYYEYDDEYGFYVCDMDLDEDETAQFIGGRFQNCPYYRIRFEGAFSTYNHRSVVYFSNHL